jgi:hypothetical protein
MKTKPRVLPLSASSGAGQVRAAQKMRRPAAAAAIAEDALRLVD